MITRIATALVGIPVIFYAVLFAPLWVSGVLMGTLCTIAVWEFMRAVSPVTTATEAVGPMLAAFVMPFWLSVRGEGASLYTLGYWLFFALSLNMILSFRGEKRMSLPAFMAGMTSGMVMPILITSLIRIGLRPENGRVNMLLPFVIAFSCDSGAYFTGIACGKKKLAPHLSPNKTVEGAVGGIAAAVLGSVIYGGVMAVLGWHVHFLRLIGYGLLGGVACELGDLSFSAVKRISGIKDYGKIIPGHGGVLDRFDSMYFTAPMVEILTFWFPAVTLL